MALVFNALPVLIQGGVSAPARLVKFDPSSTRPLASVVKDDLQDRLPFGPWKNPAMVLDFKGRGKISGTVKEKHSPANTPLRRLVRLHREPDGLFVKAVWSDAVTGYYEFMGVRPDHKFTISSYDHTGAYRAVIADIQTPEQLP